MSVVPFLTVAPTLQWMAPGNSEVASSTGPSLTHILDPVRTSDADQYTCQATVDIPSVGVSVTGQTSTALTVQSESPGHNGCVMCSLPLLFLHSPPTSCDCLSQPYHFPVCWHWPHPHLYCLTGLQCGHRCECLIHMDWSEDHPWGAVLSDGGQWLWRDLHWQPHHQSSG